MNFGALPERLAHVRAEIARRQAARGWAHPVTIVAVTKGFGLDAVEAALAAGLTDLGENRVQEALEKIDTPTGRRATWHLIGHLQRNKAKHVPGRFALVHSLDSLALAVELDQRAAAHAAGAPVRVLLQVNVAREAQKSGCPPGEAPALARRIAELPHLALEGLMTIAPFTEDADVQRRTFRGLTSLRDALKEDGLWLATLSMGMSADYAIAVEEGATVIRSGTVLFGPRATGGAGGAGGARPRGGACSPRRAPPRPRGSARPPRCSASTSSTSAGSARSSSVSSPSSGRWTASGADDRRGASRRPRTDKARSRRRDHLGHGARWPGRGGGGGGADSLRGDSRVPAFHSGEPRRAAAGRLAGREAGGREAGTVPPLRRLRSEEHTSELQSR